MVSARPGGAPVHLIMTRLTRFILTMDDLRGNRGPVERQVFFSGSASARVLLLFLPGSAEELIPKPRMLELIWWVRSRLGFPRMIPEIPLLSQITSEIMSEM